MLANLRPATVLRFSAPPADSSPSVPEMPCIPSTPLTDKCAGRAYRLEIKIPPDPAARQSTASYADKNDFPNANCIFSDLNLSQKRRRQRSPHFPPPLEEFPASFAPPPAHSLPHKRTSCTARSRSTPAWDEAD